jgi:PPP family 3-phenylpropionic acid transporter
MTSAEIPTGALAPRLALFYAAFFIALGVQLPFLPVWLAAKGLDAGEIGMALAIPMLVRLLVIPVATRAADRANALRATLVLAASIAVLAYAALGLAQGRLAIMAALALAAAFHSPLFPLADAYAVRGLSRRGQGFGPVRMWGSAAFIAGSLGAGVLIDAMSPHDLIWLLVAAMLLTALAAFTLAPIGESTGAPVPTVAPDSAALRQPAFLAMLAAASLIQASHAFYYGFSAIVWQRAGLDGGEIGLLWALGVLAEIVLFACAGRLPLRSEELLVLGAAGALARWSAMALGPPAPLLPALQCLHAFSFGATYLGAIDVITRRTPARLDATAQGFLAVASGMAMAAATALAGLLLERAGERAYWAMAAIAAAGGALALLARALTRRGST